MEAALPLSGRRTMTAGAPLWFTVAVYDPGHNEVEQVRETGGVHRPRRTVRSAQLERVTHHLRRAAQSATAARRSRNTVDYSVAATCRGFRDGLQRGRRT